MKLTTNFHLDEWTCKDGTEVPKDLIPNAQELANNLQVLRDELGNHKITTQSAYRTPNYNDVVLPSRGYKTGKNSYHKKAMAWDIQVQGVSPKKVYETILRLIDEDKMKQGGLGLYNTFVHYDIRGHKARW